MPKFDSLDEFWSAYYSLEWIFMETKKAAIVDYLVESRNCVNGLSDGWHEFRARLLNMEKMWGSQLTGDTGKIFNDIKNEVDLWLNR